MPTFNVMDFGAAGDGATLCTGALQAAIDACHATGGGTVIIPAGKAFLTGTLTLKSHVHLHLESGATLLCSDQRADFPHDDLRCMIEARDASVIGAGVLALSASSVVAR